MALPGLRYWPLSTWRMPSRPANGARTDFWAISACCASTSACVALRLLKSESTEAWLTIFSRNWRRLRW